jgi:ribonuclease HII
MFALHTPAPAPNRLDWRPMPRRAASLLPLPPLSQGGGPDFAAERMMAAMTGMPVAGIDEAGRGPWAGPVVAAAVVLDLARTAPLGLTDSKQLSERRRESLYAEITGAAVAYGVGMASAEEIDALNIRRATHLAMTRALAALQDGSRVRPAAALVDGDDPPLLACPTRAIVQGDARSFSIAAASILAKVTRDRLMTALDADYPGYGFARHKGYGTAQHSAALAALRPCPIHRRSFAPVAALL